MVNADGNVYVLDKMDATLWLQLGVKMMDQREKKTR